MSMLIALLIAMAIAKLAHDLYRGIKWLEEKLGFGFQVMLAVANVGFRLVVLAVVVNFVVYFTCGLVLLSFIF